MNIAHSDVVATVYFTVTLESAEGIIRRSLMHQRCYRQCCHCQMTPLLSPSPFPLCQTFRRPERVSPLMVRSGTPVRLSIHLAKGHGDFSRLRFQQCYARCSSQM